jgi:hypothetical protein
MQQTDLLKQVLEQQLIQTLLSKATEEERESAMKMIEQVTKDVQSHLDRMLPAIQAMPTSQLEKILRDQAK